MIGVIALISMFVMVISCVMVCIGSGNGEETFGDKFNIRVGLILFVLVIIVTCILRFGWY